MVYNKNIKRGIALIISVFLLTGCKTGLPIVSEIKESKGYSLPETMIVVATERNQYELIYTDKIWSVELDEEGTTFQKYLLNQVREFLEEMKTMNLLADQEGITLDGTEKEQIKKLSDEYYGQLTKDDISYMGIKKEDVVNIYEEYCLANKLVSELTKNVDLEISDSEAKVITVLQIKLDDETEANDIYARTQAEGADFAAIAKACSKDPVIERQFRRGEESGTLEDVVFALTTGQVSGVVEEKGSYYIFQCVSDYDEEATQERKSRLYQARKKEAFDEIYNRFKADNPVVFNNDIWEQIVFSPEDRTTATNFFELYKKYFP